MDNCKGCQAGSCLASYEPVGPTFVCFAGSVVEFVGGAQSYSSVTAAAVAEYTEEPGTCQLPPEKRRIWTRGLFGPLQSRPQHPASAKTLKPNLSLSSTLGVVAAACISSHVDHSVESGPSLQQRRDSAMPSVMH